MNSRVRFAHQWQVTERWSVPEGHLKQAAKEIASDGEKALSYGYQMIKNDERRLETIAIYMFEKLKDQNPYENLKPEASTEQTGVLLLKSQAYRRELKQALGEDEYNILETEHLTPIPDGLKAMTELLEAVGRNWQAIPKLENYQTFLSPELFEEEKRKMKKVNTEDSLARIPKKVKELFSEWCEAHKDKESITMSFTKMVVEYYHYNLIGQQAEDLLASKAYERKCKAEDTKEAWDKEDQRATRSIEVFSKMDSDTAKSIEEAKASYQDDFESSLEGSTSWYAYKFRKTSDAPSEPPSSIQ